MAGQAKQKILEGAVREVNQALPGNVTYTSTAPSLFPHQQDALAFILRNFRNGHNAYLAAEAGLGKTPVAAHVSINQSKARCFYVCPPFLAENTRYEFRRFGAAEPFVIPDTKLGQSEFRKEILAELKKYPKSHRMLVVDEAHRFKGKSQRADFLFDLARQFQRILFLSGTPMPNGRPIELWPFLQFAPPGQFNMRKFDFALKYCQAHQNGFGWDYNGVSNFAEFRARLEKEFLLRQKKSLIQLPPKIESLFLLDKAGKLSKLEKFEEAVKAGADNDDDMEELLSQAHKGGGSLHLMEYRRLLGEAKAPQAAEVILNWLEENPTEAVVIFGIHRKVLAIIAEKLAEYEPLIIDGSVPTEERNAIVKEFQENPARRVFLGNIKACGVGFTLHKSSNTFLVESEWNDGENSQAIDRLHRIGQKSTVYARYIALKNSFDEKLLAYLLKKRKTSM